MLSTQIIGCLFWRQFFRTCRPRGRSSARVEAKLPLGEGEDTPKREMGKQTRKDNTGLVYLHENVKNRQGSSKHQQARGKMWATTHNLKIQAHSETLGFTACQTCGECGACTRVCYIHSSQLGCRENLRRGSRVRARTANLAVVQILRKQGMCSVNNFSEITLHCELLRLLLRPL